MIIGSSFIGLEAAMSLRKFGTDVTVVGQESVPFEKILGSRIGRVMQGWHEKEGIKFQLGRKVERFDGVDEVSAVVLDNGESLPADFVLLGIGVNPQTDFLKGVELEQDGGVKTDEYLQVVDGLFAAGDIVFYPTPDGPQRTEHWKVAGQQGYVAGLNMARLGVTRLGVTRLGLARVGVTRSQGVTSAQGTDMEPYRNVPFFWSNQQSKRINYIGHGTSFDEVIYEGNPEASELFVAYYIKDNVVKAVASMKCDKDIIAIRELMQAGYPPSVDDVRRGANWEDELRKLACC